jgi:hypothetical protein
MLLKKKHGEGYIQMKLNDDATWMEATDSFVSFLQGCGYIVRGHEVGDYLCEQYAFQVKEEIEEDKRLSKLADERILEHEYKKKRRKKNAKRKS